MNEERRLQRMAEVWRHDVADAGELARIKRALPSSRIRSRKAERRMLAVVALAIVAAAFGASAAQSQLRRPQERARPAPGTAMVSVELRARIDRGQGTIQPQDQEVPALDVTSLPLVQDPAAPPAHNSAAPSLSAAPVESASSTTAPGAWQRAAEAMSEGDKIGADKALEELTVDGAPEARDAAWLARAQLWIANGEAERARPVLQRLARSGVTPLIRRRAAELLARGAK